MTYNQFEAKWIGGRVDIDGVYGYQCVDLAKQNMLECQGVPNGAYGDAIDYWTNTHPNVLQKYYKVSSNSPQKSDLVVINTTSTNPYGHIGISNGQVNNTQYVLLEQNGSTGNGSGTGGDAIRTRWVDRNRIAGLLRPKNNVDNPAPAGNQRIVGSDNLNQRAEPTTASAITDVFTPGEVLTFDGWINGETVEGNSKWFRGAYSGYWNWSGALTDTGTHDLADLNPPPVTNPNIKVVVPDSVNIRKEPNTNDDRVGNYPAGSEVEMKGYVTGQTVDGTNIWFVVKSSSLYCHATGFTDMSVGNLPNLTETPPVEPPEPPEYEPIDPEVVNVTAEDFPSWIRYNEESDSDHYDEVNEDAYEYYLNKYNQDYKYYPIESHTHWWGSPDDGATHDSINDYIKNTIDLSVDFVVSANRVTNFKALELVSYTTGARSMYGWKTETDPSLTEDVYKTLGCLHYIVEKKNPRLLDEPIRLHKEFMSTACSDIDVDKVREYANKFKTGELDFESGNPPNGECPPCEECPEPSEALTQESFNDYVEAQVTSLNDYLDNQ